MKINAIPPLSQGLSDLTRAKDVLASLPALSEGADPALMNLIEAACVGSPYLSRLMQRQAEWALPAFAKPPIDIFDALLGDIAAAADQDSEADLMSALRIAKRRAALLIAMADLAGAWALDEVTDALTCLADQCVSTTLYWLLRQEKDGAGLFIIAMGKHGAGELNYSSDVDLIFFFDMEDHDPADYGERKQRFNRLTRRFVKIMQEQTAEGYVFRTDLRLRPDPGSTAACMSVDSAERYYESFGKSWERAAFIKARIIAGDQEAGARFLEGMVPFIWRRHLDFATIEDVREIKRLIHRHKGHGDIRTAGHDIKLGRGGIREIEFFAQTQQLVAGGREPSLRAPRTLEALGQLALHGWITEEERLVMTDSYDFLRRLEHRIQMTNDEQTHKLPHGEEEFTRLAALCGFADPEAFDHTIRQHLITVSQQFQDLFSEMTGEADSLPEERGALETLLSERGFSDPEKGAALIERWREGAIPAMRTERARGILDRIAPVLLDGLAGANDPDHALLAFDRFLSGLPAGVQLLSLFESNPLLVDLLTDICAAAPRLGTYLSRNAKVLDAVLARDFFDPLPAAPALLEEHLDALRPVPAEDFEGVLDASRRWAKERHFQIGVQLLRGQASPSEAGKAYTALAEAAIQGLIPSMSAEMAKKHGLPPGEGACVIALGRLGAGEMTAGSDLDLLVVYDDMDGELSDGPAPLDTVRYYARWTQRLVRALTVPTSEGALYEVDMRLRPSGRSGPLATRFEAFERYQMEEAWTWEHMALTRAHVVWGPPALSQRVEAVIAAALGKPRSQDAARKDAAEMRARIKEADQAAYHNPWALKSVKGGLIEADFIAQVMILSAGADGQTRNFDHALERAKDASLIEEADAHSLSRARGYQYELLQLTRLTEENAFNPDRASLAQRALFAKAVGEPDFERVAARLQEEQAQVAALFQKYLGTYIL